MFHRNASIRSLGRVASTIVAAFILSANAAATSFSSDVSDLWWDSSQSGWGIQLVQQHATVFATMYVYRPDLSPDFYVAVLDPSASNQWSGPVYRTTGPWFGGPWNPALVAETVVGSMTFDLTSLYVAHLAYTIGGTPVDRNLIRMSFANDRTGGTYVGVGGIVVTSGPCASTGPVPVVAGINHNGGEPFTATLETPVGTYTITGAYGQRGKYGHVFGSYTTTQGESGVVNLSAIAVTQSSVTFRYDFNGSGPGYSCVYSGTFTGLAY